MQTLHLPGEQQQSHAPDGPERVPLVRLARQSSGSPALTRAVAAGVEQHGPSRVAVAAFQSSV